MLRLLRRLVAALSVLVLLVLPAQAAPVELLPGVTYEKQVQFTPRGPVALTVITAPRPGGLTTIGPVVSGGSLTGPRLRVTQIQRSLGNTAITAGINGDFGSASGTPNGIVVRDGVYEHTPTPGRSSIGFDGNGTLRVTRFTFAGTWKGTGQRRPLAGINQKPKGNQTVLFTPAWGAATPALTNATAVVLQPFPAATPNADLQGTAGEPSPALDPDPGRRRRARRDRRRGGEARERGAGRHAGHGAADPAVVVGRRHGRARRRAAARAQPQGRVQDERELRVRPARAARRARRDRPARRRPRDPRRRRRRPARATASA